LSRKTAPSGVPFTNPGQGLGLTLMVVAWSAWYFATRWNVPPDYAKTPTYAAPMSPFS